MRFLNDLMPFVGDSALNGFCCNKSRHSAGAVCARYSLIDGWNFFPGVGYSPALMGYMIPSGADTWRSGFGSAAAPDKKRQLCLYWPYSRHWTKCRQQGMGSACRFHTLLFGESLRAGQTGKRGGWTYGKPPLFHGSLPSVALSKS